MKAVSLNGIWSLSGAPRRLGEGVRVNISATVPGCVQLDLSGQGYLPKDLYMGNNITETEKFEDYEWEYTRSFTAPEERENVFLVFEGVDCDAEYFLNGEKIGESRNMFIAHEFNISSYLKSGENTLTVRIKSPVDLAHNRDYPVRTMLTWGGGCAETGIRKAPHSFGWDIMPRALTSGLWRDVRLEVRDPVYFSQLYFHPTSGSCTVFYELACDYSLLRGLEIEVEGGCKHSLAYSRVSVLGGKAGRFALNIKDPLPWFPYGYGEANVYDVTVRIYSNGYCIHEERSAFGLRSVALDRTDTTDGKNGRFRFLINGVEIMCKGSNWVPLDAFHCRDASRYDRALALVKDIGCNILRCWGGNVYEDHKFFDFCDRNGIMVWQDFSMACRIYPQDEDFKKEITAEAEAVIRKLRNHPSIILWSGDNEIDEVYMSRGQKPSTNKINREWLPHVVKLNDLGRPYLPSSPYYCDEVFEKKDPSLLPEAHLWGPRDYFKSDYYKNSNAHFVSETGYHGCPSLESIRKFITPDKVEDYHNNDQWILHSSDQRGDDSRVMLMEKQVRQLFGEVPGKLEEYILASQISQAEAKKYFIERMRVARPLKTGVIWWNLLDGWPQMSDAVVDHYFEKKLAYSYIKRSQAPFVIAADELSKWDLRFYACNDTLTPVSGRFKIKDAHSEEILLEADFSAKKNTSTLIGSLPIYYSEQKILIIEWEANGERGFNHYLCGYPPICLKDYVSIMEKYNFKE